MIRLDNYPSDWVDYFDEARLGPSDPVHRASHLTSVGFAWSQLPELIQLTPRDHEILEHAGRRGIGDGFTVPAHVPGDGPFEGSLYKAQFVSDRRADDQGVVLFPDDAGSDLPSSSE